MKKDSIHYSKYVFTDTQMIPGNEYVPTLEGGKEIGHHGDGVIRITNLSEIDPIDNPSYMDSYWRPHLYQVIAMHVLEV